MTGASLKPNWWTICRSLVVEIDGVLILKGLPVVMAAIVSLTPFGSSLGISVMLLLFEPLWSVRFQTFCL
eukprot:5257496-Karenia_brevis.AAC.1